MEKVAFEPGLWDVGEELEDPARSCLCIQGAEWACEGRVLGPVGEGEEVVWPHTMAKLQTRHPFVCPESSRQGWPGEPLSAPESARL